MFEERASSKGFRYANNFSVQESLKHYASSIPQILIYQLLHVDALLMEKLELFFYSGENHPLSSFIP